MRLATLSTWKLRGIRVLELEESTYMSERCDCVVIVIVLVMIMVMAMMMVMVII